MAFFILFFNKEKNPKEINKKFKIKFERFPHSKNANITNTQVLDKPNFIAKIFISDATGLKLIASYTSKAYLIS